MPTNAENFVKIVRMSPSWWANFRAKLQSLPVLGLYSHTSAPVNEICHRGADLWYAAKFHIYRGNVWENNPYLDHWVNAIPACFAAPRPAGKKLLHDTRRRQFEIHLFVVYNRHIHQRLLEHWTLDLSTMFDQATALDTAQKNSELYSIPISSSVMAAVPEPAKTCEDLLASDFPATSATVDSKFFFLWVFQASTFQMPCSWCCMQ